MMMMMVLDHRHRVANARAATLRPRAPHTARRTPRASSHPRASMCVCILLRVVVLVLVVVAHCRPTRWTMDGCCLNSRAHAPILYTREFPYMYVIVRMCDVWSRRCVLWTTCTHIRLFNDNDLCRVVRIQVAMHRECDMLYMDAVKHAECPNNRRLGTVLFAHRSGRRMSELWRRWRRRRDDDDDDDDDDDTSSARGAIERRERASRRATRARHRWYGCVREVTRAGGV